MSKKRTDYQEQHPGNGKDTLFGGRQPRIDTAEKQRGAQNPRPLSQEEKRLHPGYTQEE